MFTLGITGGIGCGKSTAAAYFRARGVEVVDADELSRKVSEAKGAAIPEIVEAFGDAYLDEKGAMDRTRMAELGFRDRTALDRLSAIIHRHVLAALAESKRKAKKRKAALLVLDVPIPVKEGFLDLCDYVLVIWADEELRLERLEGRGMPRTEASRRMLMQMREEEYRKLGDGCIMNNGSRAELDAQLDAFAERELRTRGIRLSDVKAE